MGSVDEPVDNGEEGCHLFELLEVHETYKLLHWNNHIGSCEVIDIDPYTAELKTSAEPHRSHYPSFRIAKQDMEESFGIRPVTRGHGTEESTMWTPILMKLWSIRGPQLQRRQRG